MERCRRAIATAGRRQVCATLKGLGRRVLWTLACEQAEPGNARCLARATKKCATDVTVAAIQELGLGVYRGNGDGTLAPVRFPGEHTYIQVAAVDTNGDTIVDLVAADCPVDGRFDAAAVVLLGNGDGTSQPQFRIGVGHPDQLAAGDLASALRWTPGMTTC